MNRILLLAPLMTIVALPASARTILSLNATGSAVAVPDEAVANFEVQATKPNAATAQSAVNQAVAKALAAARTVSDVTATTNGYNTYAIMPDHQTTQEFTTTQNLTLVQPAKGGVPDAAFSDLLARLQSEGLLLTGLKGDLSVAGRQSLQREAVRNALTQLRAEAKTVADSLHMKIAALQSLAVNAEGGNIPPIGPRMMSAAVSSAPPQSAPDNVSMTAEVNAKFALDPTP